MLEYIIILFGLFVFVMVTALMLVIFAFRMLFASMLVWAGWSAFVWVGLVTIDPSFFPVVFLGFCSAILVTISDGKK
jgi:hypothetical protein